MISSVEEGGIHLSSSRAVLTAYSLIYPRCSIHILSIITSNPVNQEFRFLPLFSFLPLLVSYHSFTLERPLSVLSGRKIAAKGGQVYFHNQLFLINILIKNNWGQSLTAPYY